MHLHVYRCNCIESAAGPASPSGPHGPVVVQKSWTAKPLVFSLFPFSFLPWSSGPKKIEESYLEGERQIKKGLLGFADHPGPGKFFLCVQKVMRSTEVVPVQGPPA